MNNVVEVGVKCQYCGNKAKKVLGNVIYPHKKSLWKNKFFHCAPCDAYVGCHKTTNGQFKSMGQLANRELRRLRIRAHNAFDPMWRDTGIARNKCYAWLAGKMRVPIRDCHIGMFNETQCQKVIEFCKDVTPETLEKLKKWEVSYG